MSFMKFMIGVVCVCIYVCPVCSVAVLSAPKSQCFRDLQLRYPSQKPEITALSEKTNV